MCGWSVRLRCGEESFAGSGVVVVEHDARLAARVPKA